ncbi:MAG: DUF3344 domain-containing protein [Methanomicrobiaceae archaeon]|nr:DUF3344 domain-containing protein [Methanomicrobiaceae archaeon]
MKSIIKKRKWGPVLGILLLLCLAGAASADSYVGGEPPATVQSGTVSGGLYVDADNSAWGSQDVTKTFASIPDVSDIVWARLYVAVYCGHMQDNRKGTATVTFDGNGDGTCETTWSTENLNVAYVYEYEGGSTPVVVNDHCTRVTSDYLMWYDVTSVITSRTPAVHVVTDGETIFDGRIKMITLVVAYNDGDTDDVHYRVNQGHDVDSYLSDENIGDYIGETFFDLSGLTGTVESATLTVNHLASEDGTYTFRGTGIPSDPATGNYQGAYFGYNIWDVTSAVQPGSGTTLTYDRNVEFYKIPLATLEVKMERESPADPPVADFTADKTTGTAPLTVQFTDLSTNDPRSWAWDFDNDGTVDSTLQNPIHEYQTEGTFSVSLTATNPGGSDDDIREDYITVTALSDCDFTVTLVNPDTGNVFAREPNRVRVTVKNNGPDTSPTTEVRLTSTDGVDIRAAVPSLDAAATETVYVIDPTIRTGEGGTVTYSATADPDDIVPETDETNNHKASTTKTVKFNGYKGKRYWDNNDVTTQRTFDLRGGLLHSSGDSTYQTGGLSGGGWSSCTVTWTGDDLPLPAGASVREARLYVPYTWDNSGEMPDRFDLTFNGNVLTPGHHYEDRKNFAGYANHDYGLMTYDVSSFFNPAENTALLSKDDAYTNVALYGLTLAVIYEDATETRKQIFLNEEFDILGADETGYATTPEEATAYVPFSGMAIVPADVSYAYLTTFVPSGNGPEGDLLFNGATLATSVWDFGSLSGPQVAVDSRDVTAYLQATGNEAGIRSTPGATPVMAVSHVFLVVEYADAAPFAAFTADPASGDAPLTVQFTDQSTGTITGWGWDFDNDGMTDSTDENPSYIYNDPGSYTVKLTITGPGGSDEEEGSITVKEPAPVIDFSADTTSGARPLTVAFTAINTGGQVDAWAWDFGDGQISDRQNPVHEYLDEGTYTVSLTATGPDYTDTKTKTDYVLVGDAIIEVTVDAASITFGTMQPGVDSTGGTEVHVDVTGGTAWSVTVQASNGGYMGTGSANLASPFQLSNGGSFKDMTATFADFLTGSAGNDGSRAVSVKQAISDADQPGDYDITITFTGAFV